MDEEQRESTVDDRPDGAGEGGDHPDAMSVLNPTPGFGQGNPGGVDVDPEDPDEPKEELDP
jgi:hypothetical protein